MLLEAYTALIDWQEVLELLRSIEKEKLYTHDEIEIKKHNAYVGLLKDAGISDDKNKLDNIWEEIPRKLKYHHHLIERGMPAQLSKGREDGHHHPLREGGMATTTL